MPDSPAKTVGALLVNSSDQVLLGLRAAWKTAWPEHWDCIGGRVEPGETLDEALVREVWEELGVRPTEFRLLDAIRERRPDLNGDALHHIYAVTAWEGGAPANVSDEHSEIQWFDSEALGKLTNLADCDYLRLIDCAKACVRAAPD
jgi:8-oxo-dGTP diphosphatase